HTDSGQMISTGPSNLASRVWTTGDLLPADVRVAGSILANSLIPGGVFARGSNLDTAQPTYYAAVLTRGVSVQLTKMVDGVETVLGSVHSTAYTSGQWVQVTLSADGDALRVIVYRTDTKQWLSPTGEWLDTPDTALDLQDASITDVGSGGFLRLAGASGTLSFDDFSASPASGPGPVPRVTMTPNASLVSGDVTFLATADSPTEVKRVEFRLAGNVVYSSTSAPAQWTLDTTSLANGAYDLTVRAVDGSGTAAETVVHFQVNNANPSPPPSLPVIPNHYSHIRIAELAYSGNPMGAVEQSLLQSSVDLVIPNPKYLSTINSVAPDTPQVLYSNVSNLYQDLLTDWLTYADNHRTTREQAFYHVTAATQFQGNSPSSQPVTYFWGVTRTTPAGGATDLTAAAEGGRTYGVEFGGTGSAINIGYLEKYREINVVLNRPATAGWTGVWEYATATDAAGNVTVWKTLPIASDGTNGLQHDGQITFDPPANWVPGIVPGSTGRNYYVRFRVTAGTTAEGPEAKTLLGRDYVGANGGTSGIIPAFDYAADTNGDGYLSDAEYANRAPGKDARFVYETRLFYPYYGQMRFVTDPSSLTVQRWAADYYQRLLAANPLADGVFLDNSLGKIPVAGISLAESTATYGADLGKLIQTTWKAIAPKFVVANTAGGQAAADPVVANSAASFEEFLLRPTDATWSNVNDVAALVQRRLTVTSPSPYLVIDSSPGSTSPTDPRTEIGTLAYYYLVADPVKTFLMFFGGSAPATSWSEHWTPAAAVNVGLPTAAMTTFATGKDPQNASLTYKVYSRSYGNALVLYKPRSYTAGVGTGTTDDATATTHALNGSYRAVNADGTLGPVITQITLRNGEGAVLIKA
ncbi:MAG TPA: Ig-like domain-containing protein, partial [Fimbriiglobus sp.]